MSTLRGTAFGVTFFLLLACMYGLVGCEQPAVMALASTRMTSERPQPDGPMRKTQCRMASSSLYRAGRQGGANEGLHEGMDSAAHRSKRKFPGTGANLHTSALQTDNDTSSCIRPGPPSHARESGLRGSALT